MATDRAVIARIGRSSAVVPLPPHIMLLDQKEPIVGDNSFEGTLAFEQAGTLLEWTPFRRTCGGWV